jgi:hypothetical protein
MDRDGSLQRLGQALLAHREALEGLKGALLEFENATRRRVRSARKRARA